MKNTFCETFKKWKAVSRLLSFRLQKSDVRCQFWRRCVSPSSSVGITAKSSSTKQTNCNIKASYSTSQPPLVAWRRLARDLDSLRSYRRVTRSRVWNRSDWRHRFSQACVRLIGTQCQVLPLHDTLVRLKASKNKRKNFTTIFITVLLT